MMGISKWDLEPERMEKLITLLENLLERWGGHILGALFLGFVVGYVAGFITAYAILYFIGQTVVGWIKVIKG